MPGGSCRVTASTRNPLCSVLRPRKSSGVLCAPAVSWGTVGPDGPPEMMPGKKLIGGSYPTICGNSGGDCSCRLHTHNRTRILRAEESVRPDALCDYYGDFTDAGVGAVRTTYQVGIGHADDRADTRAATACSGVANAPCPQVPGWQVSRTHERRSP